MSQTVAIYGLAIVSLTTITISFLLLRKLELTRQELNDLREVSSRVHLLQHSSAETDRRISQLLDDKSKMVYVDRKVYNIATIGAPGCGKTKLTYQCFSNLIDRGDIPQTSFQRFEREVSRPVRGQTAVAHVFEIMDWGGERVRDAQSALVKTESINAMLMVVDLGDAEDPNDRSGPQVFNEERIKRQLDQFNRHVLEYFFAPEITKHCQTCVLFINKSDLLPGYPAQVEAAARQHYAPLIEDLERLGKANDVEIEIFVGSAMQGTNTPMLFGHLIKKILNPDDYDDTLRKQLAEPEGGPRMTQRHARLSGGNGSKG